jgi:hypothetical protein
MRKIREVLRLRMEAGLSIRQINYSTSISVGAIQKLLAEGLSWPLPEALTESRLAQRFYPNADPRAPGLRSLPGTRLGDGASGAALQGDDQAAAVGGVHRAVPEPVLQLSPVLCPLPAQYWG